MPMPQNFLSCDRDQRMLLPPDLRDWLEDDHLAWFVIDAVRELDLESFYASYRADGHGAAAHDPQMMVTLVAYAYAVGERSARGIERRCREDVAFRVICANQIPDHATIARFRVRHESALAELFGGVLGLCAKAGIVGVSVIAVDGTKLAADASDGAIRTYEQIASEILAEAGRIDRAEDELYGDARGDELPEHLTTREGRRAWLREAKADLERDRAENPEPVRRDRAERLETCRRRLVEDWRTEHRANRDYEAYRARGVMKDGRRFGRPPDPYSPPDTPEGKLNTTDPDARRMKFGRNFMPAYNAQAVTTENQIIVAAEITTKGGDFEELDPMISAAERELETAGVEENPGIVLADAGYWSNEHIDSLRERGIVPLVAADTTRNRPRKNRLGGPYDFMRRVMATDAGGELYSRRKWMVEPVFAQIKANRRIDRFKRRGRAGRTVGMASDRGHSQPLEAPPTPSGGHNSLIGGRKALPFSDQPDLTGDRPGQGFTRQPRVEAEVRFPCDAYLGSTPSSRLRCPPARPQRPPPTPGPRCGQNYGPPVHPQIACRCGWRALRTADPTHSPEGIGGGVGTATDQGVGEVEGVDGRSEEIKRSETGRGLLTQRSCGGRTEREGSSGAGRGAEGRSAGLSAGGACGDGRGSRRRRSIGRSSGASLGRRGSRTGRGS